MLKKFLQTHLGMQEFHACTFIKLTTMTEESSSAQIPKIWQPPQNSKYQKSDMNQLPYWGPTNINYNCTKFSDHGDLVTRIYAPL